MMNNREPFNWDFSSPSTIKQRRHRDPLRRIVWQNRIIAACVVLAAAVVAWGAWRIFG